MKSNAQLRKFRMHQAALGMTQGEVADILGETTNTLRDKMLNNGFKQSEIKKLIELFNLSPSEAFEMFFEFDMESKTE